MSRTLARMVWVRSLSTEMSSPAGIHCLQLGQQLVDAVDGLDDVGVALLGDDQQHRGLLVVPAGRQAVAHARLHAGDVGQADDRAVDRLDHHRIVIAGRAQLVVDADGGAARRSVEGAERAGGVGIGDRRAHVLEREAHLGEPAGIDAHADRRLLGAGDGHVGDALHLRQALRNDAVGGVVDRARLQRFGGERQDQDRRRGRIVFAEGRQRRHVDRQVAERGVERGLHVAGGALDAAGEVELHDDARIAERGDRGELGDAGDLAEPPLERRGHRRRHDAGVGARAVGGNADGGEFDARQAGDRQELVADDADQEEAEGQQGGPDRPADERPREVHVALRAGRARGRGRGGGAGNSRARSRSM